MLGNLNAPYGRRTGQCSQHKIPLIGYSSACPIPPPLPSPPATGICIGCPYSRIGLVCRDTDGSCLRTDMQTLETKWIQEKEAKLDVHV